MAIIRIGEEYLEVPDVEEAPAEPVIEMPVVKKATPKVAPKAAPVESDD